MEETIRYFFFFSSRRRHTRLTCDWNSDVCSSDLWYAGSGVGVKLAVIGWHAGVLGKLVFFVGLAILALVAFREAGFELPPNFPESLLVLALGALGLIFVLIRLISIPDAVLPADGRGIGIYISLLAALGVVLGGLLRAAEEL